MLWIPKVGTTCRQRNKEKRKLMGGMCVNIPACSLPASSTETRRRGSSATCLLPTTSSTKWNKSLRPHPLCASLFSRSLVAASGGARLSSPAPHYFLWSRGAKTPDSSDAESEGKKRVTNGGGGGRDAVLDIQLGHTAATPQTGLRVARTLKYSSGGEGGRMKRREERGGKRV